MSLIILATYTFIISLLLFVIGDTSGRKSYCIWFNIVFICHVSSVFISFFFYLSLLLSYLLSLLYFLLLFIIFNSFILSIIITKAALPASLYPELPKQLYKIMMDLGNRLVMIHFYRIAIFKNSTYKNSKIVKIIH